MGNGNIKSSSTLATEMSYNKINGGEAWADTTVVRNNPLLHFICWSFPVGPSPLNIHAGDYWNGPVTAIVLWCVFLSLCVPVQLAMHFQFVGVGFGWIRGFYVAGHLILNATVCLYLGLCCCWGEMLGHKSSRLGSEDLRGGIIWLSAWEGQDECVTSV